MRTPITPNQVRLGAGFPLALLRVYLSKSQQTPKALPVARLRLSDPDRHDKVNGQLSGSPRSGAGFNSRSHTHSGPEDLGSQPPVSLPAHARKQCPLNSAGEAPSIAGQGQPRREPDPPKHR